MAGIPPRLGAGFDPNSFPSGLPVAILGDELWRSYFDADPAVVGKSVTVNGSPRTVVGVMPRGMLYPGGVDTELWLPDAILPAMVVPRRSTQVVSAIGRLKAGVTVEQARQELHRIARSMDSQYPRAVVRIPRQRYCARVAAAKDAHRRFGNGRRRIDGSGGISPADRLAPTSPTSSWRVP